MALTCVSIKYTPNSLNSLSQVTHPSSYKGASDSIWFGSTCPDWNMLNCPPRSTQKARNSVRAETSRPSKGHFEPKHGESSSSIQAVEREIVYGHSAHLKGQGPCAFAPEHTHRHSHSTPTLCCRRQVLAALIAVALCSKSQSVNAVETESASPAKKEESALDSISSFLDPDELAPSGRKIPKAYKKQVREVVRTLRESLSDQDTKDFRRKADPAKEAIRGYIVNWRGASSVQSEVSYTALERVLRALGAFYSKAGPNARVTDELRETILKDLELAENSV